MGLKDIGVGVVRHTRKDEQFAISGFVELLGPHTSAQMWPMGSIGETHFTALSCGDEPDCDRPSQADQKLLVFLMCMSAPEAFGWHIPNNEQALRKKW
ncbi:MAG: hypothetical protein JWR75_1006 [Devosia sp.]|nr:hypothetical protein [Devosia sp.]